MKRAPKRVYLVIDQLGFRGVYETLTVARYWARGEAQYAIHTYALVEPKPKKRRRR
jgi:hypothetical protein